MAHVDSQLGEVTIPLQKLINLHPPGIEHLFIHEMLNFRKLDFEVYGSAVESVIEMVVASAINDQVLVA